MNTLLSELAVSVLVVYIAVSVLSALRMYFVHSSYVHIEFAGKKWRSFGEWAPRQYRRLAWLRGLALLSIVVLVVLLFEGARL